MQTIQKYVVAHVTLTFYNLLHLITQFHCFSFSTYYYLLYFICIISIYHWDLLMLLLIFIYTYLYLLYLILLLLCDC